MIKELISPYMEGAFSEEVLHKVVLSKIDFELPDVKWKEIEVGFSFYWDVEVGVGNYVSVEDAYFFIRDYLKERSILLPNTMLWSVLEIMFDFIVQIPGAILDDTDDGGAYDEYDKDFDEEDDYKFEGELENPVLIPFKPNREECPF